MAHQNSQGLDLQKKEWSNDLYSYGPCNTDLLGTYMPCILLGQTSDRIRDPTMETAESCNCDCMIFCTIQCMTGCGWIYTLMKRRQIREQFGIKDNGMSDCYTSYWCSCCAPTQQEKEVKATAAQSPITEAYQPPGAMSMAPISAPAPTTVPRT
ncbi:PLAC8 family-domain-containing protein [Dactylonectria estremocensis]|uniref:PLAC8 family-domain-containing protein n=1 Tax=Dactylonectria estremocensis TaxID=1079267 RepID=A0A9P9DTT8_9HYPO|nr:PLAC8 family-domain-containing protein [Dactylonectria estremocensis]